MCWRLIAAYWLNAAPGIGLDVECRREQRPRVGAALLCQKLQARTSLNDLAIAHDDISLASARTTFRS